MPVSHRCIALLKDTLRYAPEFGDRLSNHLSMAVVALEKMGAPPSRLEAFANTTAADPSDGKTIAVHAHHLNGQPAIQVDYENEFGSGRYTIFELPDGAFLLFIPNPAAADRPDVLAIRDSITVSPDSIMNVPQIKPAAPPFEEDASCLWGDLELRSPQASGG
ncbi:MAG: hypothetical protein ACK2TX_02360 [Anaerolineales bacterium]